MDRQHLPLLLASRQLADPSETEPLDRLRMQKGVFLLGQRGPAPWREFYEFQPYNWGPYSGDLQSDVRTLLARDMLSKEPWPGRRYSDYRTTHDGELVVAETLGTMPDNHRRFVRAVRAFVTTRSFRRLLQDVYAEYPEYAVNSRFQG